MATSGPVTYLVMEDQFPSVPRFASAWHRLRACRARSTCISDHPGNCAGGDVRERPVFAGPVSWLTAGSLGVGVSRRRGPDASLPGPGAVPHPPPTRAPCPSRCPRPGPGGIRYAARHQTIARPPSRGHRATGPDTGAAVTCAFTAMARIWRGCPGHPRSCRHGLAGLALAGCQGLLVKPPRGSMWLHLGPRNSEWPHEPFEKFELFL
jgi:hypothetical protein